MKTALRHVREAVLGVPVLTKVMGIVIGLTVLFGAVMYGEIGRTRQRLIRAEEASSHTVEDRAFIQEHIALQAEILTRRLALVMAITAGAGLALAWWLARVLTQPLQEVVEGARRIQQGELQSRVPTRSGDEIGELATAFNAMAQALEQKEAARRAVMRQAVNAAEEERKRLARDLHDQTGQLLTSLIAGLTALEAGTQDARQRGAITSLRDLAEQTLGDVHDVARTLRPSALDDLGLVDALEKHCALTRERFGKEVVFHRDGWEVEGRLPAEIEVAFYRVVQEALTNAVRHADATRIDVMLERKPGAVMVVVQDNGRGFHQDQSGDAEEQLGLRGIEERARLLGGHACLESVPGGGTQLFVEVPTAAA